MFGTRYFIPDEPTPNIINMRRLIELCETCLNELCPSELLADVLRDIAFDRIILPSDNFDVIPDSFTVECDTCYHPIPDQAPFFTIEHSAGLAQLSAGGESGHFKSNRPN